MHAPEFNASFDLPDEAATQQLGSHLASVVAPGLVIYLEGDLGAGKTTLARALLRALGYQGPVKSPTYALVEIYVISSLYLYHFDFYRFESPEEFLDAGFDEYFNENSICLVEWPDRALGYVPVPDLRLSLVHVHEGRQLAATACSPAGASCIKKLITDYNVETCSATPAPRSS